MSKKNIKTECSGMEWGDFLVLIDRLKKNQEYQFLLFIAIGCYCGLRISDILKLKWSDIINTTEMFVQEKKTGKSRRIAFNDSLREIIELCYGHFSRINGMMPNTGTTILNNRAGKPLSIQYINRKLHELFKMYKVKVLNPSSHTCRKTFGKRVYEMSERSEASLVLLSHIFNHSSTSITRKYIGINQEQIQDVYLSL